MVSTLTAHSGIRGHRQEMMEQIFSPDGFSASGGGPLYLQLQRRIIDAIASGQLQAGDSLPSERDMAQMTGLSRVTVRRCVQDLVASGRIVQRRGSGTFVAQSPARMEQALSLLTSFTEDMARRGRRVESQWLHRGLTTPDPEEVMALGLGVEDRVARLERVRGTEDMPLAIERTALPASILPDPETVSHSLYAVLEARGLRPVRAVQRISATHLTSAEARHLHAAPGQAALRIERVSYLDSGRIIEFTRALYRGDAYDFAVELTLAQPKP